MSDQVNRRHIGCMVDEKRPDQVPGTLERFLSHLHKLEETLEHELIEWSERDAIEAQKRVDRLAVRLKDLVARLRKAL